MGGVRTRSCANSEDFGKYVFLLAVELGSCVASTGTEDGPEYWGKGEGGCEGTEDSSSRAGVL